MGALFSRWLSGGWLQWLFGGNSKPVKGPREKLKGDLRKFFPNVENDVLEEFASELEKRFGVLSLDDDLLFVDEDELAKIETLKVAQKRKFLEYAKNRRDRNRDRAGPEIRATAIKTRRLTMRGNARAKAIATGGGKKSGTGNVKATALEVDESALLEGNAQFYAAAHADHVDYSNAKLIAAVKEKLDLPDEKIQELLEELEEKFGVYNVFDLQFLTPKDIKTLKSLIGVKLRQFEDYVKEIKESA